MVSERPLFCFASVYDQTELLADPLAAREFLERFVDGESFFVREVRDDRSGLILDGINLDPMTGRRLSNRAYSAPSKECLDLAVLIKVIEKDTWAVRLMQPELALQLLHKKIEAYEAFQRKYPGYAGFLPWYDLQSAAVPRLSDKIPALDIQPMAFWSGKIPGLDNGEWMWSMLAVEHVLRREGHKQLAQRYAAYNQKLKANVARVFFDPQLVACRGDVRISDMGSDRASYAPLNPGAVMTGEHGVHEGCMLIHYLTLFGQGLPAGAADRIWANITMKRVETEFGTTWQGFWGSAHESWAYLFLPFRDHPGYRQLHRLREKIRCNNAVKRSYPGFATSANGPEGRYLAAAGIEGIGSQPIEANHAFAVYGVFPMMLEFSGPDHSEPAYQVAWLHNMLLAPRMQGPLGAGECALNNGTAFAACKTADGTLPTLLGLMGGLEREMAEALRQSGHYHQFYSRIDAEYQESFSAPLRDTSEFVAPQIQAPLRPLGDYSSAPVDSHRGRRTLAELLASAHSPRRSLEVVEEVTKRLIVSD